MPPVNFKPPMRFCATECEQNLLRDSDLMTPYEEDVEEALTSAEIMHIHLSSIRLQTTAL